MKKLTVLLAAVMAFAFSANAYAANFSDIAEQPVKVQDSIAKTVALGIINGYEDGTFGPEQNITRAEFAKIAVTAAGAKDTADMLANNNSSFKDVKAAQWYTGWVNASESLGIFQGDGNGNFRPNDTITNQEVITVLMRLLGYNDNLTGTWPVNYVTQANKSEILDDVAVVAAAPAKRADVVVMLDATLDTELVTYDKDTNEFVLKQTTKSGSDSKTLMEDAFKGTYFEVPSFGKVDSLRDADKQTLNWDITYKTGNSTTPTDDETVIIDKDTRVSYNGTSLFDLEGHQGKVYYVKDNDKLYARFIEVESYTKTVTDAPKLNGTKVEVNKTKYNGTTTTSGTTVTSTVTWTTNAPNDGTGSKNSNYVLYFNDDDQVYAVKSDKDYTEETYYVKSVTSSTAKLYGSAGTSKSISSSDDALIYTEDGFITFADLKAGDAVQKITTDLYVKVDEVTGTLTKKITDGSIEKYTVDGKNYVAANSDSSVKFLDDEYEATTVDIDDMYGNEVRMVLNKNNTISAMIVDDSITGTKLYGIVLGADGTNGVGNNKTSSNVTLFTAEGKTVTYDFDLEGSSKGYSIVDHGSTGWAGGAVVDASSKKLAPGAFVEYKLNKDGEIKTINVDYDYTLTNIGDTSGKIEIDDNRYIGSSNAVLADNAVIFEVSYDDDDVDATIITKSSFLSEDDLTPKDVKSDSNPGQDYVGAYFAAFTNSNKEIKALAYTESSGTTYYYGIADGDQFSDGDRTLGIAFAGDEETYDLELAVGVSKVTGDDLVVYTKSGDTVEAKAVFKDKETGLDAVEVKGWASGRMSFEADQNVKPDVETIGSAASNAMTSVKTDDETVVYVINSVGKYELGDLDSISKGGFVKVVLVDDKGYAELVIVDEYNH